jgi:methylenetetrahydrofolate dehydrogenase (NADP+)/methenyltetrahydrofolate cyclohydrolase
MNPKLIDGKETAKQVVTEVAVAVQEFTAAHRPPQLTVIIVGTDPASQSYVRSKVKMAGTCGIESALIELPADITEEALLAEIDRLNKDTSVSGILVQLPLPAHIDQQTVIERVAPAKDVDGIHPFNLGRLVAGDPRFVPCTPNGIIELLDRRAVATEGKHVVIVGRSIIVGKPLALLLARKHPRGNATVTLCHSRSGDLKPLTRTADILVAAVGRPEMITGDMVKEGAVVIDVGVNRVADATRKRGYRLVGDVDFDAVIDTASLITPVPGGVGPMTVAMLMRNTLSAAVWAKGDDERGTTVGR